MIKRAASAADLGINAHAHMLRLACGYKLANDGHDTRAIQSFNLAMAAVVVVCFAATMAQAQQTSRAGLTATNNKLDGQHLAAVQLLANRRRPRTITAFPQWIEAALKRAVEEAKK